jgi:hypothetical protein
MTHRSACVLPLTLIQRHLGQARREAYAVAASSASAGAIALDEGKLEESPKSGANRVLKTTHWSEKSVLKAPQHRAAPRTQEATKDQEKHRETLFFVRLYQP